MDFRRPLDPPPFNPWGDLRPVFGDEGDYVDRDSQGRGVARYALAAMFVLFVRTLLWVLDGVFYTNPPEVRVYSLVIFLVGGFSLWRILDFKGYARRLFICLSVFTWSFALAGLWREYQTPVKAYTSIQVAEYAAFMAWIAVSLLFVLYLFQPRVRTLFNPAPVNPYQRAVFFILLVHLFYFQVKAGPEFLAASVPIGSAKGGMSLAGTEIRFQDECALDERDRVPGSVAEEALSNYCRCDSKVLMDRCPPGLASRDACVRSLHERLDRPEWIAFLERREACTAQYFPREKEAIHQRARQTLENGIVQRLSAALPLNRIASGEGVQRKFLYCVTLAQFSKCRDQRPSASQACLSRPMGEAETAALKERCLRVARAKSGDFETKVGRADDALESGKFTEAIRLANEAIALGSDRPDGYLVRGLAYVRTAQHKQAVEDLTIVLNLSDFTYTRVRALENRHLAFRHLGQRELADVDAREACGLGRSSLCGEGHTEPASWLAAVRVASHMAAPWGGETGADRKVLAAAAAVPAVVSPVSEPVVEEAPAATPEPEPVVERAPQAVAPPEAVAAAGVSESQRDAWSQLMQVGELAWRNGDPEKGRQKFLDALRFAEGIGKGNELWVETHLKLAGFHRDQGEADKGEEFLRKTFPYWAEVSERVQKGLIDEVARYSVLYQASRQWRLKERMLLEIWKEASAAESLYVRDLNAHLSSLYQASGKADKLDTFYRREAEIFEKRFGKKDPRTEASRAQLSNYYLVRGDVTKARAVLAAPTLIAPEP